MDTPIAKKPKKKKKAWHCTVPGCGRETAREFAVCNRHWETTATEIRYRHKPDRKADFY